MRRVLLVLSVSLGGIGMGGMAGMMGMLSPPGGWDMEETMEEEVGCGGSEGRGSSGGDPGDRGERAKVTIGKEESSESWTETHRKSRVHVCGVGRSGTCRHFRAAEDVVVAPDIHAILPLLLPPLPLPLSPSLSPPLPVPLPVSPSPMHTHAVVMVHIPPPLLQRRHHLHLHRGRLVLQPPVDFGVLPEARLAEEHEVEAEGGEEEVVGPDGVEEGDLSEGREAAHLVDADDHIPAAHTNRERETHQDGEWHLERHFSVYHVTLRGAWQGKSKSSSAQKKLSW